MADRPLSIDIRHPLILKANELVLLTREDGDIPRDIPGFGLFYRDTCYLGAYELRLQGTKPLVLMSSDVEGMSAQFELTNQKISRPHGADIPDHKLALRRSMSVVDDGPALIDTIVVRNFAATRVILPLELELHTTFESMFVLRGAPRHKLGKLKPPVWRDTTVRFCYEGADGVERSLLVEFSLPPIHSAHRPDQSIARFEFTLPSRASQELVVTLRVHETPHAPQDAAAGRAQPVRTVHHLLDGYARLESAPKEFAAIVARSLSDVALLEVRRGEHRFTAAGIPWFVGLFGRDSLLPSIQCLAFNPDLGAHTARALAHWQGRRDDEFTQEEPGKILHELRVGELAHLHEVPQTPSYAAVDSTLLFLIAIARHVNWTGDPALFEELRSNIDAALAWLARKLSQGNGYVTYEGLAHGSQPINQSWRDSGTGVLREDGSYPVPPLALVEVQGYAFQAMMLMAGLLRRNGEVLRAAQLETTATDLRERFIRDFWMEAQGCYCLALERGGRQVSSVTSNCAQVLWTGIATPEQAARIAARVMRPDMFSGWGVRTLSAEHAAFDPLAYQQGSVWAFDNALIVAGFRRYHLDEPALRIVAATVEAARGFRHGRLPEFIAGNARYRGDAPTHTPRADPLQAWSAGAVPFMLSELLGLQAEGFAHRLIIRRPLLPDEVDGLTLQPIRVAGGTASLRFSRRGRGVEVEVIASGGGIEVCSD